MFLTLHRLAETYNLLPSEALGRANTFDLFVLDLYYKWSNYQQEQSEGKTGSGSGKSLTQEDMKAMIERAKNFQPKERK